MRIDKKYFKFLIYVPWCLPSCWSHREYIFSVCHPVGPMHASSGYSQYLPSDWSSHAAYIIISAFHPIGPTQTIFSVSAIICVPSPTHASVYYISICHPIGHKQGICSVYSILLILHSYIFLVCLVSNGPTLVVVLGVATVFVY